MAFLVDTRYVVPPLINLIVWVFIIPLAKHWARDPNFNGNIFVLALLSLAIFILLIFLLSLSSYLLLWGHFSLGQDNCQLPSLFHFWPPSFSHHHFSGRPFSCSWCLLCYQAWYEMLLQATPAPIITHITRQHPDQVELDEIVI
jgi:hypothetical protein